MIADHNKNGESAGLHIGLRIKQLREARGLTQKELAGEIFSRNMLSMIESGKALPSVETLVYLSRALDVPVGYFFAGESELILYSRQDAVKDVHQLLDSKDFGNIPDVAAKYSSSDSEMLYYLCLSYLKMAEACLREQKLVTASAYLKEAKDSAARLPYGAETLIELCNYATTLIEAVPLNLVPSLLIDTDTVSRLPVPPSFAAYLTAYNALLCDQADVASAIAKSGMLQSFHSLHIRGAVSMKTGNFDNAANLLDLALSSEGGGFYSRYKLLGDLETCRKNLGDFEMAYSLSTSRMEMLGMFSK